MKIELLARPEGEETRVVETWEKDNVLEVLWELQDSRRLIGDGTRYYLRANEVQVSPSSFLRGMTRLFGKPSKEDSLKLLRRIRELLVAGWTRKCYARSDQTLVVAEGSPVEIGSKRACKFCYYGASIRASYELFIPPALVDSTAEQVVHEEYKTSEDVMGWQDADGRTQEEVLAMLDLVEQRLLNLVD